jgi:glycosyltransferase involved in cell wall biosynthesis
VISVIITVFEQADSLIPLLHCLRAQERAEPFEILICDDGSSHNAVDAIAASRDLSSLDIRYIWQSKNGYKVARSKNNGIRCAKGDLLILLDGDILIGSDYLFKHRSAHFSSRQIVCNPRRWLISTESSLRASRIVPQSTALWKDIARLAATDIASLSRMLAEESVDVDREDQRIAAKSGSLWLACLGFSFSMDKSDGCYFDEGFEGWGPEDREFALRMVLDHHYEVIYRDDIEVFHLEDCSTGRPPFSLLPRSHLAVVSYLRNMIYLQDLYPSVDLTLLLNTIMAFRMDSSRQRWELRPPGGLEQKVTVADVDRQLQLVRGWLRDHGVYPIKKSLQSAEFLGSITPGSPVVRPDFPRL